MSGFTFSASLSPLQTTVVTSVEAAIQAIQNLIAEVQSLSELDESHASAVSAFLQDAVGVLRQSVAGREQQEEGEDTADDDRTAGRGSSRLAARGGGRKRRREEDEEDEEVGREEVRPSRSRRPSHPPPPTGGSSTGSPRPPPTGSRRSGPRPRPESGLSRQYTRQEGGMTELSWVPSSCRYTDAVAGERRGEQIGQSCEESLLYAKRVHEIILANPESPLHRLERLLDQATRTQSSPAEMDPDRDDFPVKAYGHIRALLQEARRVSLHAQRRIGRLLADIQRRHPAKPISDVQYFICNGASVEKRAYYERIRDECLESGCTDCSAAGESDGGTSGRRRLPCEFTQRTCRLTDHEFENFTMTFLNQCRELAVLPAWSPLLWSSDPQGQVRELVGKAGRLEGDMVRQGMPTLTTGLVPVFALGEGESAVEAIQYADGDGGYIVSELFPGLQEHLCECGVAVATLDLVDHHYRLLPFREKHHDALELGHEYRIDVDEPVEGGPTPARSLPPEFHEWGYEALVAARRNLSRAVKLWISPADTPDRCVYLNLRTHVHMYNTSVRVRPYISA